MVFPVVQCRHMCYTRIIYSRSCDFPRRGRERGGSPVPRPAASGRRAGAGCAHDSTVRGRGVRRPVSYLRLSVSAITLTLTCTRVRYHRTRVVEPKRRMPERSSDPLSGRDTTGMQGPRGRYFIPVLLKPYWISSRSRSIDRSRTCHLNVPARPSGPGLAARTHQLPTPM